MVSTMCRRCIHSKKLGASGRNWAARCCTCARMYALCCIWNLLSARRSASSMWLSGYTMIIQYGASSTYSCSWGGRCTCILLGAGRGTTSSNGRPYANMYIVHAHRTPIRTPLCANVCTLSPWKHTGTAFVSSMTWNLTSMCAYSGGASGYLELTVGPKTSRRSNSHATYQCTSRLSMYVHWCFTKTIIPDLSNARYRRFVYISYCSHLKKYITGIYLILA